MPEDKGKAMKSGQMYEAFADWMQEHKSHSLRRVHPSDKGIREQGMFEWHMECVTCWRGYDKAMRGGG